MNEETKLEREGKEEKGGQNRGGWYKTVKEGDTQSGEEQSIFFWIFCVIMDIFSN